MTIRFHLIADAARGQSAPVTNRSTPPASPRLRSAPTPTAAPATRRCRTINGIDANDGAIIPPITPPQPATRTRPSFRVKLSERELQASAMSQARRPEHVPYPPDHRARDIFSPTCHSPSAMCRATH